MHPEKPCTVPLFRTQKEGFKLVLTMSAIDDDIYVPCPTLVESSKA